MENYNIIAGQIEDLRRVISLRQDFKVPQDKNILEALTSLAAFVFKNFELPVSHHGYIAKEMGLKEEREQSEMLDELIRKHDSMTGNFDIERPLRGVEVFFSYGKPDLIIQQLDELKYRIACLHVLIGDRKYLNTISE